MLFAVDIDGTIAKGDGQLAPYAQYLNQMAGFGLPDTFFTDDMDQETYSAAVKASGVTKEILEQARELKHFYPASQAGENNAHGSDRDLGEIYITCNDYTHKVHLIEKYVAVNANGQVSRSQVDGTSSCSQ